MKNMRLNQPNLALAVGKSVAFVMALLCVGILSIGYAQTKPNATTDGRNLQVQSVVPSFGTINTNQRVALVIGNAAYKEATLTNPVNDARAIGQALQESGFTVILRENTDQRGMLSALREFGDKLRGGGTGLFYYAGHGMQIKGRNYLIPVGANVDREDEVAYSAVDAQAVLDKMESAGNATNIMILDACRNNPFVRANRSGLGGLASMEAPAGTLVAFATSPGAVASDGSGANGLYTQHLLNAMRQNGSKVEDVFKQVRTNVRRDSQGKQVPWESTSLEGDFYFKVGASAVTASAVESGVTVESVLWNAVKNTSLPIELRAYLNRYPMGAYAAEANAKLAQLQRSNAVTSSAMPAGSGAANPLAANTRPTTNDANVFDTSANGRDQAAIYRRTEELLAGLANASLVGQQAASTPAHKPRPIPASNKAGFTVGDRWRFQVVDKFKNEVVRNYTLSVEKLLPNGDMSWNSGKIVTSPEGNFRRDVNATFSLQDYSPQEEMIPKELRAGYKEDVKFTRTVVRTADNVHFTQEWKGRLTVKGKEKVKTPAGEFEAWRIERDTNFNAVQTNGNSRWYGHNLTTSWFVPELHYFVVREYEHRAGAGVAERERHELTSFSVRGAENLVQR
jgi:Caspase domain